MMHRIFKAALVGCLIFTFAFWIGLPVSFSADDAEDVAPGLKMAQQAIKGLGTWSTTDHTKHQALKQEFTSGDQITQACLSCHSEASDQFHKTIHWTWIDPNSTSDTLTGKGGHSVNNFCISTNKMNDKGCLKCHAGWEGTKGEVNCLACHGKVKFNFTEAFTDYNAFKAESEEDETSREMADEIQSDILKAVQAVTRPQRQNCGACHFNGGGGDGVKHGDLDTSLTEPNKELDVHMGIDGQDFACVRCHTTRLHNIAGRIYSTPAATSRKSLVEDDLTAKITCESCHTSKPHKSEEKLNDHTDKVACQSCHIPTFARVNPTKLSWDWSQAGKTKDGKKYDIKGDLGKETYMSIKGAMTWGKNVKPEYFWFNGSILTLTVKDKIDPSKPVNVSWPVGDMTDPKARIFPFKVHHGKQPYDTENKTLLGPLLSGKNGYWETLDWNDALTRGSDYLGVPFSGKFDFVETNYVFPTTHMVAPKEHALACIECHTRKNSRLQNLTGFYMPAKSKFALVDIGGLLLIIGSFAAVFIHGLARLYFRNGKEE